MQLSTVIASIAVVLGVLLVAGHAHSQDVKVTGEKRLQEREAKRRAEIAEQEKRKAEFARRCIRPLDVTANLEACRTVYRQL
jgi:hypothetical protein